MSNTRPLLLSLIPLLALACASEPAAPPAAPSSYAGQQTRAIKSLSDSEINDLRAGAGMGYAKVAELNGYPGPKHVLELETELSLTAAQRSETEMIFQRMQKQAMALGSELITVEADLDELFSSSTVDSTEARTAMLEAARLEAELRWTHVRAHLDLTAILTDEQRTVYAEKRGYGGQSHDHSHDGDHQM